MTSSASVSSPNPNYFATLALDLFHKGYPVIPVRYRTKNVLPDGWLRATLTDALIERWASGEWANAGISMRTGAGLLVAVDIDFLDPIVSSAIYNSAIIEFGNGLERIGRAPKRLLVFRCTDPSITKMTSPWWVSPDGVKHRVEILATGQQFVAYNLHPDTERPFVWTENRSPETVSLADVPSVTPQELAAWMRDILPTLIPTTWEQRGRTSSGSASGRAGTDDDTALLTYAAPMPLSDAEVQAALDTLDPDEDYDEWIRVGMALHHQYSGSERGLELFLQWSARGSKYEEGEPTRKWSTFATTSGRTPVTFRAVLAMARDVRARAMGAVVNGLLDAITRAASAEELAPGVIGRVRDAGLDEVSRERVLGALRARYRELTGATIPIGVLRAQTAARSNAPAPPSGEGEEEAAPEDAPEWVRGWVYNTATDKFFNLARSLEVTRYGFDAIYNRRLPRGEDGVVGRASTVVLDEWGMRVVAGAFYLPFEPGRIINWKGSTVINLYRSDMLPAVPDVVDAEGLDAIRAWEEHLELLFPDELERALFRSWLAYQVQNPGRKVRWAPIVKGIPGCGKSAFGELLRAVMGADNVMFVNASTLEGSFTSWAHGNAVKVIEEIALSGANRWDVANRLKPYVTNDIVEIHPKGASPYNAPNTANYLLLTNYAGAVPTDPGDRRYLPLATAFRDRSELMMKTGARYFSRLFGALRCAGALRGWLLGVQLAPEFDPHNVYDTPRKEAAEASAMRDEDAAALELIERGAVGIARDIVEVGALASALHARLGYEVRTRALAGVMDRLGWSPTGRCVWRGRKVRCYAPESGAVISGSETLARLARTEGAEFLE